MDWIPCNLKILFGTCGRHYLGLYLDQVGKYFLNHIRPPPIIDNYYTI